MDWKPYGDRILIRPAPKEEIRAGGLVFPQIGQDRPDRGVVIATGSAVEELKPDDEVIFSRFGDPEIEIDGESFMILAERDVVASRRPPQQ